MASHAPITEEGSLALPDGVELYTKTWKSADPAKARLAFVHGFSDHCNTYDNLFPKLAAKDIEVYAFDQRGWGRSVTRPSTRGLTGPTSLVLSDITSFINSLPPSPSVPLFLMGHSMGGAEVLLYAATGPRETLRKIRGFLVESPLIALDPKSKPYKATVVIARLASKVMPHRQMKQELDKNLLSRDPEAVRRFAEDDLCHDTGTLEGLAGMLDRANVLEEGKVSIPNDVGEGGVTRLFISHGTHDGVCSFEGTKRFSDACRVQDKTFKVYDGWYHRLHDEPIEYRQQYVNDAVEWIYSKCDEESHAAQSKL